MYIYQADVYCDSCGEAIRAQLTAEGLAPNDPSDEWTYDSDDFPKGEFPEDEETDSPQHCARREYCAEAIDLRDWGMPADSTLYGAENFKIGALLGDRLTDYGITYLKEMLSEAEPTPYQSALFNLWRETFADYLEAEDEDEEPTYEIRRFYRDRDKPYDVIATGLTLAEAQAHCQSEETHDLVAGWFDGYSEE